MSEVVAMREGQPIVDPMTAMMSRIEAKYSEMKTKLDAPIPANVIAEREGGGGRKLSYLEGWYVISRLNEVFGQGNWTYTTEAPKLVAEFEANGYHNAAYTAMVTVSAMGVKFTDIGYGDGKDRHAGKAHESAVKEAVTDGIKRAAKNFGMSMGLALYDKTKEFVDYGEEQPKAGAGNSKRAATNKSKSVSDTSKPASTGAPVSDEPSSSGATSAPTISQVAKTRAEVNDALSSVVRVAIAKRKFADVAAVRTYMSENYGTDAKEKLTDEQAKEFLGYLDNLSRN